MPAELLSALPAAVLFALVTTITPGPNNTMLLASGVNFGLKRTVPHLLGISAGVAFLMLAVGLGLAQAFTLRVDVHRARDGERRLSAVSGVEDRHLVVGAGARRRAPADAFL
jgi:hypothetical protein